MIFMLSFCFFVFFVVIFSVLICGLVEILIFSGVVLVCVLFSSMMLSSVVVIRWVRWLVEKWVEKMGCSMEIIFLFKDGIDG